MAIDHQQTEQILNADLANILKKVKAGKPLTKEERDRIEAAQTAEPESELNAIMLTDAELERLTDLTDRRHRQLADEGIFPKKANRRWNLVATIRGLIKYYRETAERSQDGLRMEQEELTRTRKEIAKEDLQERRGLSISRAEVGAAVENAALNMRAELAKLEMEIGPKLPLLKPQEQMVEIAGLFDRACGAFRENLKTWLSKPPSAKKL